MAKGWLKNIILSNRAVGAIVLTAGVICSIFPPTTGASVYLIPWGLTQLSVGIVNKGKRMEEEKTATVDKVESKIN